MAGSAVQQDNIDSSLAGTFEEIMNVNFFYFEDEIYHSLFGTSPNLLDEILSHPLSIDYFNVYLSLPIFGQRVFCHLKTHQLDFDPPSIAIDQNAEKIGEQAKNWLIHCRLDNYIHTDIYLENLLSSLLVKSVDETTIFSTVIDVREFHHFLRKTSGITHWNFFLDSMRLLRSRHSSRSNRIDVSHSNFLCKYSSQQRELHSITNHLNKSRIPDSNTSDAVWLQMSIRAVHQLRLYWLPRYLGQCEKSSVSKLRSSSIRVVSEPKSSSSSQDVPRVSSDHLFRTDSMKDEPNLVPFTIGNMSYLDYNPREYRLIQPNAQHDFQEELPQSKDHTIRSEEAYPTKSMPSLFPTVPRSIEDYAKDENLELFYRILVSDALAGSPFLEYISQTMIKTESVPYQTCIRLLADAEVFFSIPTGRYKERILRQFISRYLERTTTEELPSHLFENIEEQRLELITENDEYPLLWKTLLNITKLLIPHFLNYVKFDRLRFLVQGKAITTSPIFNDLRRRFPLINFETLSTSQRDAKETGLHDAGESSTNSNWITCDKQSNHPLESFIQNQFNTTEKLINTDEQCEFRPGERFPPLSDHELQQELRQFCSQFGWKDVEIVLGKSFVASQIAHHSDIKTFIGDPKSKQTAPVVDYSKVTSIDRFMNEIMNTAREIFEVDRFVSDLMDESREILHENGSLPSTASEDILLTDSSETTTAISVLSNDYVNQNAQSSSPADVDSSEEKNDLKVFSSIGGYFINSPQKKSIDSLTFDHWQSNKEFSLYQQTDSLSPSFHGLIKESTVDSDGIVRVSVDLTTTDLPLNDETILRLANQLQLYKTHHREFLLTDIKSYTFDSQKQKIYLYLNKPTTIKSQKDPTIKFAQKDKSIDVKTTLIEKRTDYLQPVDQEQLLEFIRNHQWPLYEYIGMKGQRAWRALKLAVEISSLDDQLMLDYHRDFDWISSDDDFGSFGERNYFIVRDYHRRLERPG